MEQFFTAQMYISIYIYNIKPNLGLSSRIVVFSLITLDGRLKENFVTRTHIYQGCRSFRRRSRPVACWTSRPGCLAEVRYTVWHTYGVPYTIFWGEGMEAFGEHAGCPRSCLFASYISVERFSSKVSPFQKYWEPALPFWTLFSLREKEKLLGAPGRTTRSKDATRGSWRYY